MCSSITCSFVIYKPINFSPQYLFEIEIEILFNFLLEILYLCGGGGGGWHMSIWKHLDKKYQMDLIFSQNVLIIAICLLNILPHYTF